MRAARLLLVAAALLGITTSAGCDRSEGAYAVDASALGQASAAAPTVDVEPWVEPAIGSRAVSPDPPPAPEAEPPLDRDPDRGVAPEIERAPVARFDPEAEARAREEAARALFEAEWPMHGIAYHFLAQVRARPDASSPVIGYMRRGSRFRAKAGLRGPGCARGWHEVVGGGYVCRGEGFLLGDRPQSFEPSPIPAALEDALPYPYAYVGREDAPQYWRMPSRAEEASAAVVIADLRARAASAAAAASARRAATEADALPGEDAAPTAEPDLEAPPGLAPEATVAADAGAARGALGDALPAYLRMRMLRGFYVSIDREEVDGERRFFRTVRGTYVPADVLVEAQPPGMRGVVLGGAWRPPLAFVYRRGVRSLVRDPVSGRLAQSDAVDVHAALRLEDEAIERRGARYRVSREGLVIRESALRVVPVIERPAGVAAGERWIHVDLSEQTLVAYEGDAPVFATLVSTGRAGFATPVGTFRIQSKHVSTTMDDTSSPTEAYSIEDVPWTMYFEGSYALHGAFWHDSFGHVRSHGCVNLAPPDARWLFQWTAPALPPGWHGVIATSRRPGTVVHVTE